MAESLISMSEARAALNWQDASRDAALQDLRDSVVAMWEEKTNRLWVYRTDYVETFFPEYGSTRIWPSLSPIESVTIQEAGYGDAMADVEAANYVMRGDGQLLRIRGCSWMAQVQLTITGGYTAATCPDDIKRAIKLQMLFEAQRFDPSRIHAGSEQTDKGQMNFLGNTSGNIGLADVHPVFAATVNQHRRFTA